MPVAKVIELVGTSSQSWEKAVQSALDDASKTLENIETVEVTNLSANVENGKISEWQADLRVSFRIEDRIREERHAGHAHGAKVHM